MPEEKPIDVGDSEESPVDVDISGEDKPEEKPEEKEVKVEEKSETEDELEEYSAGVQSRIDKLTKRFREEERQKQTAVQYAESVQKENESLKERLDSLDKGFQEEFDSRVATQIDSTKHLLKEAHESGDVDKMVEAQEALSSLAVEKGKLSKAKKEVEEKPVAAPVQQQAPELPPDPKAEAWAAKNEWFGQDEVMTYAVFGVHRRLIEDERFDPQSDEYYAELDKRMLAEFPQKLGQKSKTGGSRKVASAESSASRNRVGRKTVRLTPSQVAIAKRLNVPLEEYAKHVRD